MLPANSQKAGLPEVKLADYEVARCALGALQKNEGFLGFMGYARK
jgi:hypothetical protein